MSAPTVTDLVYAATLLGGADRATAVALARDAAETPMDLYRALAHHLPPARALADATRELRRDSPALQGLVEAAVRDGANILVAYAQGSSALRQALQAFAPESLREHGAALMGTDHAPTDLKLVAKLLQGKGSPKELRDSVRACLVARKAG